MLSVLLCWVQVVASAAPVPASGGRDYAETMLLTSESDYKVGTSLTGDPRELALRDALYAIIGGFGA